MLASGDDLQAECGLRSRLATTARVPYEEVPACPLFRRVRKRPFVAQGSTDSLQVVS